MMCDFSNFWALTKKMRIIAPYRITQLQKLRTLTHFHIFILKNTTLKKFIQHGVFCSRLVYLSEKTNQNILTLNWPFPDISIIENTQFSINNSILFYSRNHVYKFAASYRTDRDISSNSFYCIRKSILYEKGNAFVTI